MWYYVLIFLKLLNDDNSTGNSNSSISSAASQYAASYRAMSHYMQTDPSSASIYQYHPLYSGNPSSLTAGTNSTGGTTGGTTGNPL